MAKLRTNNQLAVTSDEELKNLAAKTGAPVATSPAVAAGQGASPDAAKMAGSPQQKFANVQPKSAQTLAQDDRRDQARQQQTQSEVAVAAKAGQLDKLSGLDDRIKGLVNQQFANAAQQAQPSEATLNQPLLDALPAGDKVGLTTLLQQYYQLSSADPASPQISQILAQLANTYGITDPDQYIKTDTSVVGQQAAQAIVNPEDVKLGTLDLTQLGLDEAQLSELIGPDYAELSVGQLQQRLQDLRAQEMSRVETLQAQLRALPPGSAQRQLILDELRDLGMVGVTGVEQGMQTLQAQVDSADQVQFAGRAYAVGDLLADDNISAIVAEYFNPSADPAWKARLQQESPEFVQWIQSNQETLSALADGMKQSQTEFQALQEEQKQLATVGDQTLSDAVMKELVPGWGESVASVSDLSGNAVYQALQSDPELIQKLNTDPSLIAGLEGLTAEEIQAASQAGNTLTEDPVLAAIVGADAAAFITDEATLQKMAQFGPILQELRDRGGEAINVALNDPEFQKLIASGELNEENMDAFLEDPEASYQAWQTYNADLDEFTKLQKSGDIGDIVDFLFGMPLDDLNDQYAAVAAAAQDPTNKTARKAFETLQKYDTNKDGKFDNEDSKDLLANIQSGLGAFDLGEQHPEFGADVKEGLEKLDPDEVGGYQSFMDTIGKGLKGYDDTTSLKEEYLEKALSMPDEWKKKYLDPKFDTQEEIDAETGRREAENIVEDWDKSLSGSFNNLDQLIKTGGEGLNQHGIDQLNAAAAGLKERLKDPELTKTGRRQIQEILDLVDNITNEWHKKNSAAAELKKAQDAWDQKKKDYERRIGSGKNFKPVLYAEYKKWLKENPRPK